MASVTRFMKGTMPEGEIDPAMDQPTASRTSSRLDQRDCGVPASAGNWRASDLTSATCNAVNQAGRPNRLR